jgi:hypothetical protein
LKQNVDLVITVDIKEQQLLADRERTLNRIKPPPGSSFDPDPKNCCMPDTRADVIESLVSFALSEDTSPRLFLLSGVAGSGKSSVSTSVSNSLHQRGLLSGSFFFKRDIERLRIPANLVHTVAYSIALQYKPYMDVLIDVLKSNPTIEDVALSIQFDALLRKPLRGISDLSSTAITHPLSKPPSVTFIIDALDECDDPHTISSYLAELVGLASWLKVIVTSRPMDESEAELRGSGNMTHLNLFTVDASEDILKFTQSRFAPGGLLHRLRSRVTEEEIQALAERSHGLFIWIKTVLSYIASLAYDGAKLKEMRGILSSSRAPSPEKGVDELYLRVLRNMAGESPDYQDAVRNFVGFISVTSKNRSLQCKGLHAFIPTSDPDIVITPEDIEELRSKLAAVIFVDPVTDALRVCHPSFLDFISTQVRSQEFWTNPEVLDTMMARRCFSIMKASLKFNICGLQSSHQRNDEIPDLKEHIPEELQYSAVHWLDHLSRSCGLGNDEKLKVAYDFLYHTRLFYWLEVMSVVSKINAVVQILRKLVVMSKVGGHQLIKVTFTDCLCLWLYRATMKFVRSFRAFFNLCCCFVNQCQSVCHTSTYHQQSGLNLGLWL